MKKPAEAGFAIIRRMEPVTIQINGDASEVDAIRKVVRSYVRLTFTEKRRWFPPRIVFTVQGPDADMQRMKTELDAVLFKVWCEQQW